MPAGWERHLDRWQSQGLLDPQTADRIRQFEAVAATGPGGRWLQWVAWGLGSFLVGAGVLLLVSTAWNDLSPVARLSVIMAGIAAVHLAGAAVAGRWPLAADVLHFTGTFGLGPAIFTAGDVFGMSGGFARAVLLWTLGTAVAWRVTRETAYAVMVAVLVPVWLSGEWLAFANQVSIDSVLVIEVGWFLACVAYMTVPAAGPRTVRRALCWTGRILFLPISAFLAARAAHRIENLSGTWVLPPLPDPSMALQVGGWATALLLPLAVAWVLRGKRAWMNLAMAAWAVVLATMPLGSPKLAVYGWLALGAIALVAWAVREADVVRLNLGVAAFAMIVLAFYFDSVMGQVGRSLSLIGLGVLFLLGGYTLERVRRRMVSHVAGGVS